MRAHWRALSTCVCAAGPTPLLTHRFYFSSNPCLPTPACPLALQLVRGFATVAGRLLRLDLHPGAPLAPPAPPAGGDAAAQLCDGGAPRELPLCLFSHGICGCRFM